MLSRFRLASLTCDVAQMNVLGQSHNYATDCLSLSLATERFRWSLLSIRSRLRVCVCGSGKAGTTACDTGDVFHNGNDALFRWLLNNISLQEARLALCGVAGVSIKFTCESDLTVQRRSAQPLDRAVWCFVGQVFFWNHSQKSWITVVAQDHFDCSISCVSHCHVFP